MGKTYRGSHEVRSGRGLVTAASVIALAMAVREVQAGGSPWPMLAVVAFTLGIMVGRDLETLGPLLRLWHQRQRASRARRINRSSAVRA